MKRIALVGFLVASVAACAEREKPSAEPAPVASASSALTPDGHINLHGLKVKPLQGKLKGTDLPTTPPPQSPAAK